MGRPRCRRPSSIRRRRTCCSRSRSCWTAVVLELLELPPQATRPRAASAAIASARETFLIIEFTFLRVRLSITPCAQSKFRSSLPRELGRLAREERGHGAREVCRCHRVGDPVPLELQVVGERVVEARRRPAACTSARNAARASRGPRQAREPPRRARPPGTTLVTRPRSRASCAERLGSSRSSSRALRGPEDSRQEVGHAAVGRSADAAVRHREERPVRGDADVAHEREREAGAGRGPVDGRDHRIGDAPEVDDCLVEHVGARASPSRAGRPRRSRGPRGRS